MLRLIPHISRICTLFFVFGLLLVYVPRSGAQPVIAELDPGSGRTVEETLSGIINTYVKRSKSHVEIGWTSSNDTQTTGFRISRLRVSSAYSVETRSLDSSWELVDFVEPKAASEVNVDYTFIDSSSVEAGEQVLYRVQQFASSGALGNPVELDAGIQTPNRFSARSYRHPSSPITTIEYTLPERVRVRMTIYDSARTFSEVLVNEVLDPGIYKAYFDGSSQNSGLYIGQIKAGKETWIEPILLVK